jgi:chromosome segregation ATPase
MGLADDWRRLVAALTGRPDTAEEARLAALFQNRSELKKELSALDDERHRLLDRLKLQEGSTMRVEEQLANLEQYLGRPEEAQKCVAYFQLRAVWRLASRRLEQFATELTRQQKDRERKQQLTEFERNRRNRLDDLDREIYDARILVDQLEAEQAADRERLGAMGGFWNYFRRRKLEQAVAERETRTEVARTSLTDLGDPVFATSAGVVVDISRRVGWCSTTCFGRSGRSISCVRHSAVARSIQLSSSRTLPGQL